MDLAALKSELLAGHPDTGPYSGNSSAAAAELNVENRTRNRERVTGSEVLNAVDQAEFLAATDAQRTRVWNLVHLGTLNPWGIEADLLLDIFGAGSATITALAAIRVEPTSRASELGFETVEAGHVQRARAG